MSWISLGLTGILTGLAFPTVLWGWHLPDLGFLAWFSLVPLFVLIGGQTPKKVFTSTLVTALIFYGFVLYWVYNALFNFGHLSVMASLGGEAAMLLGLSIYLALALGLSRLIADRLSLSVYTVIPWAWVAQDLCHNYVPVGGFSWANLAYSQSQSFSLIQAADLGGPYLITFALIFLNCSAARLLRREEGALRQILISFLVVIGLVSYGKVRLREVNKGLGEAPRIQIALLQGNVPQDEKWLSSKGEEIQEIYTGLASLVSGDTVLSVWPETAYPYSIEYQQDPLSKQVFPLPEGSLNQFHLIGAISFDEGKPGDLYNSAFLVNSDGQMDGRYNKSRLVPFGEYVPYASILSFMNKVVPAIGTFHPGSREKPLVLTQENFNGLGETRSLNLGPLICYEDGFPEIAGNLTRGGADLLVNLSNDAWYLNSSAPWQHLVLSQFRAIENRRSVVRSTNTGLTAIIHPTGELSQAAPLFKKMILQGPATISRLSSFYTRTGDLFAWFAVFVLSVLSFISIFLPMLGGGSRRGGGLD